MELRSPKVEYFQWSCRIIFSHIIIVWQHETRTNQFWVGLSIWSRALKKFSEKLTPSQPENGWKAKLFWSQNPSGGFESRTFFLQNQPCYISIFGRVPKLASLEQLDVVCIHFKNSGLGLGSKPGYANSAKQKRTQPAGRHLPKMFFIKFSTLGQSNIDLRPQTLKQSFFIKSF